MTLQELVDKFNNAPDFLATFGPLEITIEGKNFTNIEYERIPDLNKPFPHQHINIKLV